LTFLEHISQVITQQNSLASISTFCTLIQWTQIRRLLGFISNIAFLLIGIATGHKAIIVMGAAWTALSIAQITVRGRRHLSQGRA
jgi:hypothetical protein